MAEQSKDELMNKGFGRLGGRIEEGVGFWGDESSSGLSVSGTGLVGRWDLTRYTGGWRFEL